MSESSQVAAVYAVRPEDLRDRLVAVLGAKAQRVELRLGEVTVVVSAANYHALALTLRDESTLRFEQMVDLAGMDYSDYGNGQWEGARYAVVLHLLSVSLNQRVRVRVFATDDDFPVLDSVNDIWSAANWYEREAFDLYGIVFEGHEDLRRILTDYGFIGHPFRKDFPSHGHVEMRYDEKLKRVIYQPVTIELRDNVPRVIREDHYGGLQ